MSAHDVSIRITELTVSALPEENINHPHFSVKVSWRGDDRYAVERMRRCLGADGEWDFEPSPSNREDDWIATHRFAYEEALKLARQACLRLTVNGFTVDDVLGRAEG